MNLKNQNISYNLSDQKNEEFQKVFTLIATEETNNIDLAFTIAKGLDINIIQELHLQYEYLIDILSKNHTNKNTQIQEYHKFTNIQDFFKLKNIIQLVSLVSINGSEYTLKNQELDTSLLKNLKRLELMHLSLNTCAVEFSSLTSLTTLVCNNNCVEQLPSAILHFKNLSHVNFSYNQIQAIPLNTLSELDLQWIYLSHNQLTKINLSTLSKSKTLAVLDLSNNPINELSIDQNDILIQTLDISNTAFVEFPQILHSLKMNTLCISYAQYQQWKDSLNLLNIVVIGINGELFSVKNQTLEEAIQKNINSSDIISKYFYDFIQKT